MMELMKAQLLQIIKQQLKNNSDLVVEGQEDQNYQEIQQLDDFEKCQHFIDIVNQQECQSHVINYNRGNIYKDVTVFSLPTVDLELFKGIGDNKERTEIIFQDLFPNMNPTRIRFFLQEFDYNFVIAGKFLIHEFKDEYSPPVITKQNPKIMNRAYKTTNLKWIFDPDDKCIQEL